MIFLGIYFNHIIKRFKKLVTVIFSGVMRADYYAYTLPAPVYTFFIQSYDFCTGKHNLCKINLFIKFSCPKAFYIEGQ